MNGGDFRQSVYRAIRHGLMQAHSMLLEPFYAFHLTIPDKMVGRAMTDLERRFAVFEGPVLEDGQAILTGRAPVSSLDGYQTEVTAYTSGLGQLVCTLDGYGPCHNEEEVIEAAGYDPDADLANPSGSVFCSHGADEVDAILARTYQANKKEEGRRRWGGTSKKPSEKYGAGVYGETAAHWKESAAGAAQKGGSSQGEADIRIICWMEYRKNC